jgi:hypothetical protein
VNDVQLDLTVARTPEARERVQRSLDVDIGHAGQCRTGLFRSPEAEPCSVQSGYEFRPPWVSRDDDLIAAAHWCLRCNEPVHARSDSQRLGSLSHRR